MSEIQRFYAGKSIFVTGGTGFVGKVLIEKLLRSCPDVRNIYVLVRHKKGKSSQERMNDLTSSMAFGRLREECPKFAEKLVGITGDASTRGLGMSEGDRSRIIEEVSVIFHLAATVRFDEVLPKAVRFNVHGVGEIIELAKECSKLEVAAHVSTAYSNCVRSLIGEEFYEPPLSDEEVTNIIEIAENRNWSDSMIQEITNKILGDWPNTYTFTKAIAESVVKERANGLPFCVFRPSIVIASDEEPYPGWTDSLLGPAGLFVASALGIMHTMWLDEDLGCDVIPVDMTCNALLACAWKTATTNKTREEREVLVYNYVSGPEGPITWGRFLQLVDRQANKYPASDTVYFPWYVFTKSWLLFVTIELFCHTIPAFLIDILASLFGKKPGLSKVMGKIAKFQRMLCYFTRHQWTFEDERIRSLWEELKSEDRGLFFFSMKNFDWERHAFSHVQGIRKFLLNETEDGLSKAKRRHFLLRIVHIIAMFLLVSFGLWITWKLFRWTKMIY